MLSSSIRVAQSTLNKYQTRKLSITQGYVIPKINTCEHQNHICYCPRTILGERLELKSTEGQNISIFLLKFNTEQSFTKQVNPIYYTHLPLQTYTGKFSLINATTYTEPLLGGPGMLPQHFCQSSWNFIQQSVQLPFQKSLSYTINTL